MRKFMLTSTYAFCLLIGSVVMPFGTGLAADNDYNSVVDDIVATGAQDGC